MRIAFLGTGNMGQALIKGLLARRGKDVTILAYDKIARAVEALPPQVSVIPPREWRGRGTALDAVVVAVKPADVAAALREFRQWPVADRRRPLWISIAAGVNVASLQASLGAGIRICRVMPNTPCLIGEGFSAYCLNDRCGVGDGKLVESILASCGSVVQVPEKLMHAVTGLSGSGPAYVFLFTEALVEGGVAAGLPYEVARAAAVQTVAGAALLARQSTEGLADLRRRVTSPGGTTARGLLALEEHRFKYAVVKAVADAAQRGEEMEKAAAQASGRKPRRAGR